jgi:hypothetical protein
VYQRSFLDKPTDIIYLCLSFIQKWKILMKAMTRSKMEAMLDVVLQHLRDFRPLNSSPTDVGFV